jgi:hypothetical protein
MRTPFLAQLAHRAVAGSDVKPRIASRFETLAPMEHSVERVSDVPAAVPVVSPASPRASEPIESTAREPHAQPRESLIPAIRTVSHTEIVERVRDREIPVLLEPPARKMPTPAPDAQAAVRGDPPRAPILPELQARAQLPTPLLARVEPAPAVSVRDPDDDSRITPTLRPAESRAAETRAALLVPTGPISAPAAMSSRLEPVPAPALAPIEIVIGRIEIRGDTAPSAPRTPAPAPRRTSSSLDAYLRGREERNR